MIIHFALWMGSFYISFIFVGVWNVQSYTWTLGSIIGFCIETFLFEILIELIIAIFYSLRSNSITYV